MPKLQNYFCHLNDSSKLWQHRKVIIRCIQHLPSILSSHVLFLSSYSQRAVSTALLLRKQTQIKDPRTDLSGRWQCQTSCSTLKSGILSFCSTKYSTTNYVAYDSGLGSKKAHLRRWENKDVLFHLHFYSHLLFYHISSPLKFHCPLSSLYSLSGNEVLCCGVKYIDVSGWVHRNMFI